MEIQKKLYSIAIIGYKSVSFPPWDPESIYTGLPGSEEAIVYASEALTKLGYKVDVYMDPPEDSIWKLPESNPRWFSVDVWSNIDYRIKYDLVVMWRDILADIGRLRGKKVFYWPHDVPKLTFRNYKPTFDGICWLSNDQKNRYATLFASNTTKYTICGNGHIPSQFEFEPRLIKKKHPYKIGYFSNYSKGLNVLLYIWPFVRRTYPRATLDIYYGRETFGGLSLPEMDQLLFRIKSLESSGVTEKGKVGHLVLAEAMKDISIWAYPCIDIETFCITAIKAQASGCIPVTTRLGALNETISPLAPSIPMIANQDDVDTYKKLLCGALSRVEKEETENERMKYIDYAKQFTWDNCVKKWVDLYHSV